MVDGQWVGADERWPTMIIEEAVERGAAWVVRLEQIRAEPP
jgi:hypothetical protein